MLAREEKGTKREQRRQSISHLAAKGALVIVHAREALKGGGERLLVGRCLDDDGPHCAPSGDGLRQAQRLVGHPGAQSESPRLCLWRACREEKGEEDEAGGRGRRWPEHACTHCATGPGLATAGPFALRTGAMGEGGEVGRQGGAGWPVLGRTGRRAVAFAQRGPLLQGSGLTGEAGGGPSVSAAFLSALERRGVWLMGRAYW